MEIKHASEVKRALAMVAFDLQRLAYLRIFPQSIGNGQYLIIDVVAVVPVIGTLYCCQMRKLSRV